MLEALGNDADIEIDCRPFWIPAGVDLDSLSEELKSAIAAIVNPAYRDLVLEAGSSLERLTGLTVVHLLWLEILDQIKLGERALETRPSPEEENKRAALINQHLRTIGAKQKATNFLQRLREFHRKCTKEDWGM